MKIRDDIMYRKHVTELKNARERAISITKIPIPEVTSFDIWRKGRQEYEDKVAASESIYVLNWFLSSLLLVSISVIITNYLF